MTRVEPPPRRRTRTLGLRSIVQRACLLALLAALPGVPSSIAATLRDTTATRTYLRARYEVEHAFVQNAAASRSVGSRATSELARECHGVLAGAPTEPRSSELQMRTILEEFKRTIDDAVIEPDRAAIETFVAKIAHLRWSKARLTAIVHFQAAGLQKQLAPAPAACADARTWVQSGYRTLSPASLALEREARRIVSVPDESTKVLLAPYENARERMLVRRANALRPRVLEALETEGLYVSLQPELGVPRPSAFFQP